MMKRFAAAILAILAAGPAFAQATALPGSYVMMSPVGGGFLAPRALVSPDLYQGGSCPSGQLFYNNAGQIACEPPPVSGVTSVAQTFTGGLITVTGSPITTSGTLALTVAGTSGGVPYFSSGAAWASSAQLAAGQLVQGGGAGAAPSTFALGGDCTLASPNITCTKTGGVAFTPLATLATGASGTVLTGGGSPSFSANPSVTTITATGLASAGSLAVNAAGMVGDGVTSNNSALSTIWSGLAGGGYVTLPCGVFKVSTNFAVTLAAGKHLTLQGGGVDCTELYFSGTTAGLSVTYGSQTSGVRFRDLTITTDDSTGVNTAITLSNAQNTTTGGVNELTNVTLRGHDGYMVANYWGTGVLETGVSNINFMRFNSYGAVGNHGTGISLQSTSSTAFSAVINLTGCSFWGFTTGVIYGDYVQGLQVVNSNFTTGTLGINVPAGLHTAGLDQLAVTNSQFGSITTADIQELTNVANTIISDSMFIIPANGIGINYGAAAPPSQFIITGNTFGGVSATNNYGISFGSTTGAIVGGLINNNIFSGLLNSIAFVTGTAAVVTNNQFFSVTNYLNGNATVYGWGNVPDIGFSVAALPACGAAMYGVRLIVENGTAFATGVYGSAVSASGTVWRQILCTPSLGWVYN